MVLANAGLVRVTGDDGKPGSLPDLPRQKIGTCTFRNETTIVTVTQRVAVRGLLGDAGVTFENGQEAFALSALLDRLESLAALSGGEAPAPNPDPVPEMTKYKGLSGNDLLAALAGAATLLRHKIKAWQQAGQKIKARENNWQLAAQLVRLGAEGALADLENIRGQRLLLADPDPVPPLIAAAANTLRAELNSTHALWEVAWAAGEQRLGSDATWVRLSPDQKQAIRNDSGLLLVTKPVVDTPQAIAKSLHGRGFSEWENMVKALPARIDDALAAAAALLEPKARSVQLPGALVKSEAELDAWLKKVRAQIVGALADGPVIPKV